MTIKDRIDPLIAERAPWLFSGRPGTGIARAGLDALLGYKRTVEIGNQVQHLSADGIMEHVGKMLANHLTVTGLSHIPSHGAALIVANHPTGIADGVMLHHLLRPIRNDTYYFANHDIMRVLPQYSEMIAPVEWRQEKRSHAKMRETMAYTRKAVEEGRLGVIFPSGRLAKRRGLSLHERPWMASAAMIARKFDLPVIPVNIQARNSALFYLFDLIHPTLRDITLFHETLNKATQPYHFTIGEPISPSALPAKSEESIEMLRKATLALGGPKAPVVPLLGNRRSV
ncbi:1-acyl-sn-glycerol-3-phosphate acyltransferase [Tropicibacter naphthalenivorans]|uniref:2-acyl-glycerophospho-ethanolamine acyltransferase n=1 Tax=Tropicibacter naphthalenivorans TaxID=441103 RepID=A0A0P1GPX1_9RHOB|nr:1-acyl-sn-glycerol-3-phosphate acyltransferase [Tropicibacter naphthalenivorans]CUH76650.1 2-acyl-glycerophospho-ethanolamine acyltransferase [Tropicibacter naphthalenivorans]SMC64300.1 Acyltransferase [Tropicibacter naphthalenivorans]